MTKRKADVAVHLSVQSLAGQVRNLFSGGDSLASNKADAFLP